MKILKKRSIKVSHSEYKLNGKRRPERQLQFWLLCMLYILKTTMRKYWRLILVLVTCLSFILMFAYRQKYSKLSLIVQLRNAFQHQDSEIKFKQEMLEFQKKIKTDFFIQETIAGMPYWKEIFPGVYVYSTYWLSKVTRTLVFATNLPQTYLKKIKCKLHYEDKEYADPPKTNIIFAERNDTRNVFFIECIPHTNMEVPYSVSFSYEDSSSPALPVIHGNSHQSNYALCIKPLPPSFADLYKLLEFIIYHSHMGIKLFIFYENGLSTKSKKLLLETAAKDGVHILLLPWNLPLVSQIDFKNTDAFLFDCVHRVLARNHSEFVLSLNLNEFIVPKDNWNINNLGNELSKPIVKFQKKMFCTNFKSDLIAQNLNVPFITLLKTKFVNENLPVTVGFDISNLRNIFTSSKDFQSWLFKKKSQKFHLVSETSAAIHSYESCGVQDTNEFEPIEDKSMWMYKDMFFTSHLYLLAKESNLILN